MILGLLACALGAEARSRAVVGAAGEVLAAPPTREVRRSEGAVVQQERIVRECGPNGCFRPGEEPSAKHLRMSYAQGAAVQNRTRGDYEYWERAQEYDGKTCSDDTELHYKGEFSVEECAEKCQKNPQCKWFSMITRSGKVHCTGCKADWGKRPNGEFFSAKEREEGQCTGCKGMFGTSAYFLTERVGECPEGKVRSQRSGDCVEPLVEGHWEFTNCGEALTRGKCELDRWVATHCCDTCVSDCRCDRTSYYVEGVQYDTKTFSKDELNEGNRGLDQAIVKCRDFWSDAKRNDELGVQHGFVVNMRHDGAGVCRRIRQELSVQQYGSAKSTLGESKVGAICDTHDIARPADKAEQGDDGKGAEIQNCPKLTCVDCTSKGEWYESCRQCQADACKCAPEGKADIQRPCTWHTADKGEGENVCSCKDLSGNPNDPEDYLNWWHTTTPAP